MAFGGSAVSVPTATVQAEHYDTSPIFLGQSVGYRDTTLGNQAAAPYRPLEWVDAGQEGGRIVVSDLAAGEWLDYTVDVEQAGYYDLELRFLNDSNASGDLDLLVDGVRTAAVSIPPTNSAWSTGVLSDLPLDSGEHTIELVPGDISYKLDYFDINPPVQCPATAVDDAYNLEHGNGLALLYSGLTANDLPPGGELSLPVVTRQPAGTLDAFVTGFQYTPPADYQAQDSLEYMVYSDGNPDCWDTATVFLTITPPAAPVADFTFSCDGSGCSFDGGDSSGWDLSYGWWFGDGSSGVGGTTVHAYGATGTYVVTLTVTDEIGRVHQKGRTVALLGGVDDAYAVTFGDSLTLSAGDLLANDSGPSLRVDAVAAGPYTSDVAVGGSPPTSFSFTPSTCFAEDSLVYRLSSTTAPGTQASARVTFDTLPDAPPVPAFGVSCTGYTCTFTDASSDDHGYQVLEWSFGDGSSTAEEDPVHVFGSSGTYAVDLTVIDLCGQAARATQEVEIDLPPQAALSVSCDGTLCRFDASASTDDLGITSYAWDFGDGATGSGVLADHEYNSGGSFTVRLVVTDAKGQQSEAEQVLAVEDDLLLMLILLD
jgi:PKD repeat protein